ncbi:hypothetical protein [uncultured Sphingomonas sp.]|uniref:hypothetical protein n=1 Tax=uncultured Sphingomonas sp. TaxID=158754 RepID=UPI0035CAE5F7
MPTALNSDFILTSDDPITYDQVAEVISAVCGRKILHHRLTKEALADRYHDAGMPEPQSQRLASMDQAIADGAGDQTTVAVKALTGKSAISFPTFANAGRKVWDLP